MSNKPKVYRYIATFNNLAYYLCNQTVYIQYTDEREAFIRFDPEESFIYTPITHFINVLTAGCSGLPIPQRKDFLVEATEYHNLVFRQDITLGATRWYLSINYAEKLLDKLLLEITP